MIMSNSQNTDLLENFYDEAYDYFSKKHPNWDRERICYVAEQNAKRRFEDLSQ
tara:strand:- start:80 stop:238 length:159 start_codon:yes stop_codon:yes gene_type:complete